MRSLPKTWAGASLLLAAALTVPFAAANHITAAAGIAELYAVFLWMAFWINGAWAVILLPAWPLARRLFGFSRDERAGYFAAGFAAMNLAWALFCFLTPAQWWYQAVGALTVPGLLESAAIAAVAVLFLVGAVRLRRRPRTGAVLLGASLLVAATTLVWDLRLITKRPRYSLEEVRIAAERGAPPTSVEPAPAESDGAPVPVFLLGFDGLSWDVMKPLLEAGRLPNFARLIRSGAIGYLDNGSLAYSPPIWTTIFTGRRPASHQLWHFRRLVLPRSGVEVPNVLLTSPTAHSFFGFRSLIETAPNPGLWITKSNGPLTLPVKTVWDIASEHGRRVAVVNPMASVPVQPVNGLMMVLRGEPDPTAAWPPSLAAEWAEYRRRRGISAMRWREAVGRPLKLVEEFANAEDFIVSLFDRAPFDLGVFYTHLADGVSHAGWNFYAPGKWFLHPLPDDFDNSAWEHLVKEHLDAPVLEAYRALDNLVGRLMQRRPGNYIIVSDHGWSYSGWEHSGSPDGILILSGPAFESGADLEDARITDIAPTVLALLGLPLSKRLPGEPLTGALRSPLEITHVDGYGSPHPVRRALPDKLDREQLERLKALGYIR